MYSESKIRQEQNFAARFAAKEAFFKALGTGWSDGLAYIEVEMINQENGKPEIILYGKSKEMADKIGIKKIHVSVSHIKEIAHAVVLLET
jgi:holo-[acyl-carrier protein] synthase